jgi:hypothetical protein
VVSRFALVFLVGCGAAPAGGGVSSVAPGELADSDGMPGLECAAPLAFEPEVGCHAGGRFNTELVHEDRMSAGFVLDDASYALDRSVIARFDAPPNDVPGEKDIAIARAHVSPGAHTLSVLLHYRGHGVGVFSYLSGYRFEVRSSHAFTHAGGALRLVVSAHEQGAPTTPLEERPHVSFRETPM